MKISGIAWMNQTGEEASKSINKTTSQQQMSEPRCEELSFVHILFEIIKNFFYIYSKWWWIKEMHIEVET